MDPQAQAYPNGAPDLQQHVEAAAEAAAPQIQTLTRRIAQEARAAHERGFVFPLPATGGVAQVRKLSIARLGSMVGLSPSMQAVVLEIFEQADEGIDIKTWQDVVDTQEKQDALANGMCIAGFIKPRLVETQAEADMAASEDVLWVEEIHIDDRLAYLETVLQPHSRAAREMEPFPTDRLEGTPDRPRMPAPAVAGGADGAALGAPGGAWVEPGAVS